MVEAEIDAVTITDNTNTVGKTGNRIKHSGGQVTFLQDTGPFAPSGTVRIEVPMGTALTYDLNTASGDISFDAIPENTLKINGVSSNIQVLRGGDALDLNTVSGSCHVYGAYRNVDANTVRGSIYLTADATSERISINGVSGDTRIRLSENLAYTTDLSSMSGNVESMYAQPTTAEGEPIVIDGNTVSGGISIGEWE